MYVDDLSEVEWMYGRMVKRMNNVFVLQLRKYVRVYVCFGRNKYDSTNVFYQFRRVNPVSLRVFVCLSVGVDVYGGVSEKFLSHYWRM